jgi:hypothetical protein
MMRDAGALILGGGAILFLIGASFPISFRVYPEPSPARKLEHITGSAVQWSISQVLFGFGSALPVIGIAMLTATTSDRWSDGLILAGAAILAIALVPWIMHLHARTTNPAAFAAGELPGWQLASYFLLTPVGIALFGVAMLTSGVLAPWVGWVVIGSTAVVLGATVVIRDMVPAVYYIVMLLPAIMLLRSG